MILRFRRALANALRWASNQLAEETPSQKLARLLPQMGAEAFVMGVSGVLLDIFLPPKGSSVWKIVRRDSGQIYHSDDLWEVLGKIQIELQSQDESLN